MDNSGLKTPNPEVENVAARNWDELVRNIRHLLPVWRPQ
jgi:hypothetical protein